MSAQMFPSTGNRSARDLANMSTVGKVLIVDDLYSVRILLRSILTGAGHTVVAEASTGREAVSLYLMFRPEVVMMDITMPDQDGLTAMEEILRVAPSAQIVVCTALSFKWVAAEALKRGACDFIVKPFKPEAILTAMGRAVLRARSEIAPREFEPDRAPVLAARPYPEPRQAKTAEGRGRGRWRRF